MGLKTYRFKEWKEASSYIEIDVDGINKIIEYSHDEENDGLKSKLEGMEKDKINDVVVDNTVIYSAVDEWEYMSTRSAINILNNSIFIGIYGFLETRLRLMCKLLEAKASLKLKDLSDNGIRKCKAYLSKVHDVSFESAEREWQLLTKYAALRNRLVHHDTNKIHIVEETREYRKLKDLPYLTVKERDEHAYFYIVKRDFLVKFNQTVHTFLRKILYC